MILKHKGHKGHEGKPKLFLGLMPCSSFVYFVPFVVKGF